MSHESSRRLLMAAMATVVAFASASAWPAEARGQAADAIYVSGKVVTVNGHFSIAQAFAVGGERFVAIGDDASIRRLAGPDTQVVDLGGRTVVPGFVDTHAHTVHRGLGAMASPSLVGLRSVAEIASRIGEAAAKAPPGAWIVSSPIGDPPDYFNLPEGLAEKRWPTRADLDKVAPRNPVYIPIHPRMAHPAIFNGAALALLDVTRNTPDEPGTRIHKDSATGEPTGVIYGLSLHNKVPLYRKLQSLLPPMPPESQVESLRRAMRGNIAVGVTTIYEGHGANPAELKKPLQVLRSAGEPLSRVVSAYEVPAERSLAEIDTWMTGLPDAKGAGSGDDMLKILGVTVSMDGPTQLGFALMNEPYLNPHGKLGNGESKVSMEKLVDIARLAVKNDLRLNIVAAGSKACAMAIEALETVNRETPIKDRRWVVQHYQHPTQEQIARLRDMGVVAQTYSSADFSKGAETYVDRFPGQDVWKSVVPLRWWIDGGVTIAQSTDGAHYDPMFTIWESLVRIDGRTGKSLLTPAKSITRQEAIQLYTINGARLLQWEDRIGSIEVGKLADFVVLDHDILTVPVEQIRDTKAVLTAVAGRILHDSLSLATWHRGSMNHMSDRNVDAIFLNGKVITVDDGFSIARAFAVHGDRFVAVGEDALICQLAGPDTRVIDLGG